MKRRILGILAMLMASAALAVVVAHASPLSGPIGGPTSVGSGMVMDPPSAASSQGASVACGGAQSGTSAALAPTEAQEPDESTLIGCVASVNPGASSFTVTTAQGDVTVIVNQQTEYSDGLNSLASLQQGTSVSVDATTQPDGTAVATKVGGPNDAADSPDSNATDSNATDSNDSGD